MLSFSIVLFRNAKLRIIHFTDHFLFCYVYIRLDQTLINRFVFCFRYYYCNFASSNFKISIFINIYAICKSCHFNKVREQLVTRGNI